MTPPAADESRRAESPVGSRLAIVVADITTLPVDAIVNAADESLLGAAAIALAEVEGFLGRHALPEHVLLCAHTEADARILRAVDA